MTDALMPPAAKAEALRLLGAPKEPDVKLDAELQAAYATLMRHARPRSIWRIFDISVSDGGVEAGGAVIRGAAFAELCRGLQRAVLMAVTLGAETDTLISRAQRLDMAQAVLLDACASACAETLCCAVQQEAFAAAGPECFPTMRFSPGYGGTELSASAAIIEALGADKRIGVSMTASGLLVPVKSITAIAGITAAPRAKTGSCEGCAAFQNCMYRKRGADCGGRF